MQTHHSIKTAYKLVPGIFYRIILLKKKAFSDLRQVNGFLRVLQFSPIKLTDILLKGALNTINHLP
jgi:hypothetical protein